jgi:HAE1 family hydrophobic/amphiphilic exporter-1
VNLGRLAIRRPVAVSMMILGIILLGFVSLGKIPLNLMPDITYPKITVRTEYPHAAPREVEERVTKFIESAVGIIQNVVKVSSISRPGWSEVYVEFQWSTDIDVIAMDIREKIQLLENLLPEEVGRPVLLRYDPNQDPILTLAVSGNMDLSDLRRWVEMNMELELERLDGVAAVKVEGGYEDEILVDVDEQKLTSYGLSLSSISDRLRRENVNLAAGSLEEGGNRLAVRTVNRFTNLDDIRGVIVAERNASGESGAGGTSALASMPGLSAGGMGGMMGGMGGGMVAGLGSLLAGLGGISSLVGAAPAAATGHQAVIRLRDIAAVTYQHKERSEIARLNDRECIKVSIFKEGDANIVTVARAVQAAVASIKETHRSEPRGPQWERELGSPTRKLKKFFNLVTYLLINKRFFLIPEEPIPMERGIAIEVISDQSVFILQAIYAVAQNAVIGSMLALMILYLFLRNWSSTLIVGVAIPVSFIATFNLMYFAGISFNIMSLGGLALGVGVLVDNSIIVIENILRHRAVEPDLALSARRGSDEMAMPVISGTLTNVIVFLPVLYLQGMFRQIFGDLAWTVTFSTLCSAAAALAIVPMMSVVLGKSVKLPQDYLEDLDEVKGAAPATAAAPAPPVALAPPSPVEARKGGGCLYWPLVLPLKIFLLAWRAWAKVSNRMLAGPLHLFDAGFRRVRHGYPELLRVLLKRPFLVSVLSVGIGVLSVGLLNIMSWEMMPSVDQGEFRVRVELPTGTPIEETNKRIAEIEERIRTIAHRATLKSLFATVGIGTAEGEGTSEKAENLGEIHVALVDPDLRSIRDELVIQEAVKALAGEVSVVARTFKPQLMSYKAPVEIEIEGRNLDDLEQASEMVLGRIQDIPGLLEVESSMGRRNPEINITVDRNRAAALGLSVSTITDVIQRKVKGEVASRFDQTDQQIDIQVQIQEKDRANLERLAKITIPSANGDIRLDQVATIKPAQGPAAITRAENGRVALITANIHGRPLGDVVRDIEARIAPLTLPADCTLRITGQNEEMVRSLPSLYLAVALAILLVYIILASEFESLAHPFIILFTIPFAMVGMALILILTGQTLNIFTLIGILMMIGILDNVAIVLVSAINQNRDYGMERTQAIVEAARTRLRPILITNLTTILGMMPMAIAWGPGTELSAPMAITVIGGLSSATFLTLLTIPCLYLALDTLLPRTYHPHRADETEPGLPAGGGVA